MLLVEAEKEFRYIVIGSLVLPYDIKLFQSVLSEVEQAMVKLHSPQCNFTKGHALGGVVVQTGPNKCLARRRECGQQLLR